jgi:IS5 family transposase
MRRFAGLELVEDAISDETPILGFRHLLERHQLTEDIFADVRSLLEVKRLLLRSGTIVDAAIIEARLSTKNEHKARDPEMRQGKKGRGLALRDESAHRHRCARPGALAGDHPHRCCRYHPVA